MNEQVVDPKMIKQERQTEIVNTHRVACDGGKGALGHPRVWLQIDPHKGFVICGYCDKQYVLFDFEHKNQKDN